MSFLCDTNVISELVKPEPNLGVLIWAANISSISLSVITLEEIAYGLSSKPNQRVQIWFESFLKTQCDILPITAQIAEQSGKLRGELRTQGKPRTQADMLIAATAMVGNLILVTRNIRDFEGCDLQLLNPFSE